MRKEIFKVGYQKPKSSPLQGIEPGSSCIVVLQFKKIKNKNKKMFTIGGNRIRVFADANIVFTDRIINFIIQKVKFTCLRILY